MAEKIKLYDATKCIGCRACQLACKQWNDLPAHQTKNTGSYQNPADLQPNTWLLMRFQERETNTGEVEWLFHHNACMHCTDAACVNVCPTNALFHTKYGTVALDQSKCTGCKECVAACPFNIPRFDPKTNKVSKCDMCFSRLERGMEPACVKACPTGALQFGDKNKMLRVIKERFLALGSKGHLYGDKFLGGTHVLYILPEKPDVYEAIPANPKLPEPLVVWKDLLKPLSLLVPGIALVGAFLHYLIKGPKNTISKEEGGV